MCAGMEDASRWGEGFTGRVPSTQWEISVGVRLGQDNQPDGGCSESEVEGRTYG